MNQGFQGFSRPQLLDSSAYTQKGDMLAADQALNPSVVTGGGSGKILVYDATTPPGVTYDYPYTTNLLTNGGMEFWNNGTGPFLAGPAADGWRINFVNQNMSAMRESTTVASGSIYSVKLFKWANGEADWIQYLSDRPELIGKTLSFNAEIYDPMGAQLQLEMTDNIGTKRTPFLPGASAWQKWSLSYKVLSSGFFVCFTMFGTGTAYIDNVYLTLGGSPKDLLPTHPGDEIMRNWHTTAYGVTTGFMGGAGSLGTAEIPARTDHAHLAPEGSLARFNNFR